MVDVHADFITFALSLTSCSVLLSVLPLGPTSTLSLFQPSALPSVLLSAGPLVLLSNLSLAPLSALHVVLPEILSPVLPSASFTLSLMLVMAV